MTHRPKREPIRWAGVSTGEMAKTAGISTDTLKSLRVRGVLTPGLYFYTLPGSPKIIWVRDLVRDFLINGNTPAHQKAIDKYLASLPSSDGYTVSAA